MSTLIETIATHQRDTLVGGHVARTGTRADVTTQLAFMDDLKNAAETALKTTSPGEGLNDTDRSGNPWAVFDHYIDRVSLACESVDTEVVDQIGGVRRVHLVPVPCNGAKSPDRLNRPTLLRDAEKEIE